jgi:hypothetical protein
MWAARDAGVAAAFIATAFAQNDAAAAVPFDTVSSLKAPPGTQVIGRRAEADSVVALVRLELSHCRVHCEIVEIAVSAWGRHRPGERISAAGGRSTGYLSNESTLHSWWEPQPLTGKQLALAAIASAVLPHRDDLNASCASFIVMPHPVPIARRVWPIAASLAIFEADPRDWLPLNAQTYLHAHLTLKERLVPSTVRRQDFPAVAGSLARGPNAQRRGCPTLSTPRKVGCPAWLRQGNGADRRAGWTRPAAGFARARVCSDAASAAAPGSQVTSDSANARHAVAIASFHR